MSPWRARPIIYLVALGLVLVALDVLLVLPRWLAVAIGLGNLAVVGAVAGWGRRRRG